MIEAETMKLIIKGAVAEAGAEKQFNQYLDDFRQQYDLAKGEGEINQAAYMMALSYFTSELA